MRATPATRHGLRIACIAICVKSRESGRPLAGSSNSPDWYATVRATRLNIFSSPPPTGCASMRRSRRWRGAVPSSSGSRRPPPNTSATARPADSGTRQPEARTGPPRSAGCAAIGVTTTVGCPIPCQPPSTGWKSAPARPGSFGTGGTSGPPARAGRAATLVPVQSAVQAERFRGSYLAAEVTCCACGQFLWEAASRLGQYWAGRKCPHRHHVPNAAWGWGWAAQTAGVLLTRSGWVLLG